MLSLYSEPGSGYGDRMLIRSTLARLRDAGFTLFDVGTSASYAPPAMFYHSGVADVAVRVAPYQRAIPSSSLVVSFPIFLFVRSSTPTNASRAPISSGPVFHRAVRLPPRITSIIPCIVAAASRVGPGAPQRAGDTMHRGAPFTGKRNNALQWSPGFTAFCTAGP